MKKLPIETADTIRKVQELAAYREDFMSKNGRPLSLKYACTKMEIAPYTIRRFAPELYEKWKELDFHWEVPRAGQGAGVNTLKPRILPTKEQHE